MSNLIGSKVSVIRKDGIEICGTLQYIGYNEYFPNLGLHCTISGLPFIEINTINDINKIKEITKIVKK
jgi:hypothetical protein